MYILKSVIKWGWSPIIITALALLGYNYEWPIEVLAVVLIMILVIGLILVASSAREKKLELASQRLRQLAGYFNRRFAGNSSLSIFAIIDSLFAIDNPKLWDWARACDMSQRIFNTWCSGLIGRVESDIRTRSFGIYLRTYLNELWLVTSHYYEFVEQFFEIAERLEMPQETIDQYNRFVMEYNSFVNDFRDNISELRKVARTEIEPPSVKFAKELSGAQSLQSTQERGEKPSQTTRDNRGYYL